MKPALPMASVTTPRAWSRGSSVAADGAVSPGLGGGGDDGAGVGERPSVSAATDSGVAWAWSNGTAPM